jgi:hypothetical protein
LLRPRRTALTKKVRDCTKVARTGDGRVAYLTGVWRRPMLHGE